MCQNTNSRCQCQPRPCSQNIPLQLTDDGTAILYLPLCSLERGFQVTTIPDGLQADSQKFSQASYNQFLAEASGEADPIIQQILGAGYCVEVMLIHPQDIPGALPPATDRLALRNGCDQLCYTVIPGPLTEDVCNKVDYRRNIAYTRIWLSHANVRYLDRLGLFDGAIYHNQYGITYPLELKAALKTIMNDAGFQPRETTLPDLAYAFAYNVYHSEKEIADIDLGCGIRITYSHFLTNEITSQY